MEKDFMLSNEYRRLKAEDIRKLRERQKRLEQTRKLQMMIKEKEHEEFLKNLNDGERVIQRKKQ